ncbi:MAG: hypothetical protein OXQ92_09190 [Boseongicola sp.]|nr:hypothetical protein [Boseongicola sp.]
MAEELYGKLGDDGSGSSAYEAWPTYDESLLVEDTVEMPIQVNGKLRGRLTVGKTATREEIEALALKDEKVVSFIEGKTVRKVIVVPNKLVNLVVG